MPNIDVSYDHANSAVIMPLTIRHAQQQLIFVGHKAITPLYCNYCKPQKNKLEVPKDFVQHLQNHLEME